MSFEEYTWQRYYEDLYHRQKKINNSLAVELGEKQAKAEELNFALNRVINSPFWKALAPARKIYGRLSGNGDASATNVVVSGASGAAWENGTVELSDNERIYRERLALYEDFYGQWIRKDDTENMYSAENMISSEVLLSMDKIEQGKFSYAIIEDLGKTVHLDCNGEWIVFVGKKGFLAKGFEKRLQTALEGKQKALIAYADEDYIAYDEEKGEGRRYDPFFKPDWSPDTLDSFFYFGHIAMIKTELASKLNWLGSDDPWVNVYDFFLQASEYVGKHYDCDEVLHISQVLYHNISSGDSDKLGFESIADLSKNVCLNMPLIGASEAFNQIKEAAFDRRSKNGLITSGTQHKLVPGQDPDVYQILYDIPDKTLISVLILSKDHPEVLRTCLSSFIERTDYSDLEFIIVDNGSSEANKAEYEKLLNELVCDYPHKYIYRPMEFNFSAMCNIAASEANGDLLLFMNDDIEIVQKDWLRSMAGYALLPHAGAVGAKLLYAGTDQIQHIGITNLEIGPSHKLVIYPDDKNYYFGRNLVAYDMIGVTAACLLIDKIKFKQIGGFNEEFAVAYNDVDLCMKICEAGYNNIQCNNALLYHYESMTRGQDAGDDSKWTRLLHEKQKLYSLHPSYYGKDPYYNANLIQNHSNYLSSFDFGYNNHLKTAIVRQLHASNLASVDAGKYKISLDFAGIQAMHNLGEPEIAEFRGWCFEEGSDNFDLKVNLVLKSSTGVSEKSGENGKKIEGVPIYVLETEVMPRDDLEKVFENACHIRLCGFVVKVLKEDLPEGTYSIGVEPIRLKHDLTDLKEHHSAIFTDATITI